MGMLFPNKQPKSNNLALPQLLRMHNIPSTSHTPNTSIPPFQSSLHHWTRPTISNLFILWMASNIAMAHSSQPELQLNTGSTGRGALGSMVNPLRDIPILSWFVPPAPPWNGPLVQGFVGTGRTPQSCHNSIKIPFQLQFISIEWVFNRKYSPKIPAPNGSTPMEKLQIFGNSVGP